MKGSSTMTERDKIAADIEKECMDDELVASIKFYYDGMTQTPKFSMTREDREFIDPLTVYAMACMTVLENHYEEVVEQMSEITDMNQTSLRVH